MKTRLTLLFTVLLIISCSDNKQNNAQNEIVAQLQTELDSLKQLQSGTQIATFLTFQKNNAEQAMRFYLDLFENSKIIKLTRWGKEGPGKEGAIMHAIFELNGKQFMCSDSPAIHDWGFTPAVSNYIDCKDEKELEDLFAKLSENGKVLMPLNNYGFSQRFGFLEDQFGVSWQLNLK